MAEQRTAIEVKTLPVTLTKEEIELNEAIERRIKLKSQLRVNLLERSGISTALDISFLPPGIHGEWERNNPMIVEDKIKRLNYEVFKQKPGTKLGMHDANADGSVVVGDLILMTCSQENFDIIEELRLEEYNRRHGKPGAKEQAEEKGFISEQRTLVGSHIGTAVESRATSVSIDATKKG
jgi:hypothetical protein